MCFDKAFSRFAAAQRGTVAIIFAFAFIPVLLITGAAVDYTHVSSSKAALQEQLDAAILAGTTFKTSDNKEKIEFARKHFYASTPADLKSYVHSLDIDIMADEQGLHGAIDAIVPTQFMHVLGWDEMRTTLISEADITVDNRQLDMVFCIDATGSMQEEINGVTSAASSLEDQINAKLKAKHKTPFNAMRVRVIFYRDFGAEEGKIDLFAPPQSQEAYNTPNFEDTIAPMNRSNYGAFWTLPEQRTSFKSFLASENANAGEDEPESGFVCLNEALESPWAHAKEDKLANDPEKTITSATHLIAIWTDANARPINDPRAHNLPSHQPRDYEELKAKWDDPNRMSPKNKLLVFFGDLDRACATTEEQSGVIVASGPETTASDTTGSVGDTPACPAGGVARWRESIGQWGMNEFVFNYSLQAATNDLAGQIADALAKQPWMPRLTR
ncbi:MAG: TadE/TadG family type IV pilus assembly protein [Pseudomonadota bacterium]